MTVTLELSDREVQFLNKMVNGMGSYEKTAALKKQSGNASGWQCLTRVNPWLPMRGLT